MNGTQEDMPSSEAAPRDPESGEPGNSESLEPADAAQPADAGPVEGAAPPEEASPAEEEEVPSPAEEAFEAAVDEAAAEADLIDAATESAVEETVAEVWGVPRATNLILVHFYTIEARVIVLEDVDAKGHAARGGWWVEDCAWLIGRLR